jgi:hypothetical protein
MLTAFRFAVLFFLGVYDNPCHGLFLFFSKQQVLYKKLLLIKNFLLYKFALNYTKNIFQLLLALHNTNQYTNYQLNTKTTIS